jgi:GNAT superfamily N-acetyltransferase
MRVSIRSINENDAAEIAELSRQLGYPLAVEQISRNIQAVISSDDHDAFVAVCDGKLAGWIGVAQTVMIESVPYCEINGLVIDEDYRGNGLGRLLVEKARQWAKQKGNQTVRLRCNVVRKEAHLFYEHLGFKETKQQKNYEIQV